MEKAGERKSFFNRKREKKSPKCFFSLSPPNMLFYSKNIVLLDPSRSPHTAVVRRKRTRERGQREKRECRRWGQQKKTLQTSITASLSSHFFAFSPVGSPLFSFLFNMKRRKLIIDTDPGIGVFFDGEGGGHAPEREVAFENPG